MSRRVVVTGLGAITSIGNNVKEFWEGIRTERSGAGPNTKFDTTGYKTKIACEVKDFNPQQYLSRREISRLDAFSQYATVAAIEAMDDANLESDSYDPHRAGIILGIGIGGFQTLEDCVAKVLKDGAHLHPFSIPKLISNIAPAHISIKNNVYGPVYSIATACASGTDALTASVNCIKEGSIDITISGGAEACITRVGVAGFNALQALSVKFNDSPHQASRPFDLGRDGFVIGEGAGILILEELEHARKRNAHIYGEIIGCAMTCDAYHHTAPHNEGRGAIDAMRQALANANIEPEDVDYINAHGTSTTLNDIMETQAIKNVFGEHAYKLKISSTKSMHGHAIGAAGGIEAIATLLAIQDQYYPPTINLEEPDPKCDLDYVPLKGQQGKLEVAMSNSFGFGGHNGVIIIRKYDPSAEQ